MRSRRRSNNCDETRGSSEPRAPGSGAKASIFEVRLAAVLCDHVRGLVYIRCRHLLVVVGTVKHLSRMVPAPPCGSFFATEESGGVSRLPFHLLRHRP